jgi:hypothetical protein
MITIVDPHATMATIAICRPMLSQLLVVRKYGEVNEKMTMSKANAMSIGMFAPSAKDRIAPKARPTVGSTVST